MMTLMTVIHAPLISDGALSGLKAVYSPVSVKSFSEILLSPWLMFIDRRWDTECYLVHSVLILPVVPYCNWMPSAFDMVT